MNARSALPIPSLETTPPVDGDLQRLDTLFVQQAQRTPGAVAIMRKGEATTYRALDQRANRFANTLKLNGLRRGSRVAIALPRSADLVAAMIGCMKAGCVYIPLDMAQPTGRLNFILQDSGAEAIVGLGQNGLETEFAGLTIDAADLVADDTAPGAPLPSSDPAYILYTSGSTGQPKGVLLGHNASHYIAGSIRHFQHGELARVAAVTSVSFDPSVFEIFAPLASGGTILLKDNALEPFTADEQPTLLQGVPTALRQLARAGAIPDSVKVINSGGETLTRDIADEIFASCAAGRIYNHYGPTEASICTTIAAVDRNSRELPDIGVPVAGARLLIRDPATARPVAEGETGEIWIGGPVLAHGYVGDGRLTAERFVEDPLTGLRAYRTGDLGRIGPDGRLAFLGRIDDQVKLRGHRIELAEIDDAIVSIDGIEDGGTIVSDPASDHARLIVFACARSPEFEHDAAVLAQLRQRLPASMIPHRLIWLSTIPRLASGKIDRAALARMADRLQDTPPPRTAQQDLTNSGPDGAIADTIGRLFGEALKCEPLAPEEDFFAAGGDSLMCVDIALQLEDILDRPIAVNLLAHHSSPRALARAISHRRNGDVFITRDGNPDGEKLFFAPGIRGTDTDYDSLKTLLAHRSLIMLHALPLAEEMIAEPRIETLVTALAPMIDKEQPEGTVALLGFSFGGIMAYALADALEQMGRRTRVIIIDAQITHCSAGPRQWAHWAGQEMWPAFREHGMDHAARRLARSLCFWFPRTFGRFRPRYIPEFISNENPRFVGSLVKAVTRYRFRRRTAPTLLIVAERMHPTDLLNNPDRLSGWRGLLRGPGISIRHMDVTHSELVRRPVVNRVAALLEGWLAEPVEPAV